MTAQCPHCHAWMWIDERNEGSRNNPKFELCCGKGTIVLPALKETPPELSQLLRDNTPRAKDFRKHIRVFNNALSFTSLGVQLDDSVANSEHGAYNFRIHGSVHHRIGGLLPNNNATPAFAQIYVHDPDATAELNSRANAAGRGLSGVDERWRMNILAELQAMMHRINPFV